MNDHHGSSTIITAHPSCINHHHCSSIMLQSTLQLIIMHQSTSPLIIKDQLLSLIIIKHQQASLLIIKHHPSSSCTSPVLELFFPPSSDELFDDDPLTWLISLRAFLTEPRIPYQQRQIAQQIISIHKHRLVDVIPFLTHLPHSLPHSSPSLIYLTPSLTHLPHSLIYLTHLTHFSTSLIYLPHSLTYSLPHYLTYYLTHSLSVSLHLYST